MDNKAIEIVSNIGKNLRNDATTVWLQVELEKAFDEKMEEYTGTVPYDRVAREGPGAVQ